MIGDPDLKIAKLYGMLPASASGDAKQRTPADNQTVRNVFIIGYRISAQLGVLSFFLGVLSLILAVLPLIAPFLGSLWERLY